MARFAELADGTRLEFPDDTPDDVMQTTVKKHLGVRNNDAEDFAERHPLIRGIQGPTALAETLARGLPNFAMGLTGKVLGTAKGALTPGESAVETGKKWEAAMPQIPSWQKGSAYFDEQIAHGLEAAKTGVGNLYDPTVPNGRSPEKDDLYSSKRAIVEGLFDMLMAGPFAAELQRLKPKPKAPAPEEPIRPGPQGVQEDLFTQEEAPIPKTERSAYHMPPDEFERLQQELNPQSGADRTRTQNELFTDYQPTKEIRLGEGGPAHREGEVTLDRGFATGAEDYTFEQRPYGSGMRDVDLEEMRGKPMPPSPDDLPRGPEGGRMVPRPGEPAGPEHAAALETPITEPRENGWTGVPKQEAPFTGEQFRKEQLENGKTPLGQKAMAKGQRGSIGFGNSVKEQEKKVYARLQELQDLKDTLYERMMAKQMPMDFYRARRGEINREMDSLTDKASKISDNISHQDSGTDLGNMLLGRSQRGSFLILNHAVEAIQKALGRSPLPPKGTPTSQARVVASIDERSWDQVKKENPEWAKMEDMSFLGSKNAANLTSGSFASMISRDPRVKWLSDTATRIVKEWDWKGEKAKYGDDLVPSQWAIGRFKLAKDPNAPMTLLKDVLNPDEVEMIRTIGRDFAEKNREATPEELRAKGFSDRAVQSYQALMKGGKELVEQYNKMAIAAGKKPIRVRDGYMVAMRKGDYKIDITDANTGRQVYSTLVDSLGVGIGNLRAGGATSLKSKIEKAMPGHKVEISELESPVDRNKANIDTLPFQQALRAGYFKGEGARQVEQVIDEFRSRRGFGQHGLYKKFVPGEMGYDQFKDKKANNHDFVEAWETYFDEGYRSIANMHLEKEIGKFLDDKDVEGMHIKEYARDIKDAAQGKYDYPTMLKYVDALISHSIIPTSVLGYTDKAARTFVEGLGRFAIMKFMGFFRPWSLMVQKAQPYQFGAQMLAHYQTEGYKAGVTESIAKGELEAIMPSKEFLSFLKDYALPKGVVNPQLVHAFDLFTMGEKTRSKEIARWITGTKALEMVEAMGRLEVAGQMWHFFKDSGETGKALYSSVERGVNDVMGDYTRTERPQLYKRTGLLGVAGGPLSTFHHLYLAQTLLYLKDLSKFPDQGLKAGKPMALHIANMFFWGGMLGMVGVSLGDGIIDGFKKMGLLPPEFKNVSERILTSSKVNNMMAFGPVSSMTGWDLSTSLGNPQPSQSISGFFPGVGVATNIVNEALIPEIKNLIYNIQKAFKSHGVDVDLKVVPPSYSQKVKGTEAVLPNAFTGAIEKNQLNLMDGLPEVRPTKPGEVAPDVMHRGLGGQRRDEADWMARYLGGRTMKERRELLAQKNTAEQKSLEIKQKQELLDLAADVVEGKKGPPLGTLAKRALDMGMSPDSFQRGLEKVIEDRKLEKTMRLYGINPNTIQKYHQYQQLQEIIKNSEKKGG